MPSRDLILGSIDLSSFLTLERRAFFSLKMVSKEVTGVLPVLMVVQEHRVRPEMVVGRGGAAVVGKASCWIIPLANLCRRPILVISYLDREQFNKELIYRETIL